MSEEKPKILGKTILFVCGGLFLILAILLLSFSYLRNQDYLWKIELTRKAVVATVSFVSATTDAGKVAETIDVLKANIEEIKEVTLFRKSEDKFQVIASTDKQNIGEITNETVLLQSFERGEPVPILQVERAYDGNETYEERFISVYTPLSRDGLVLHSKFSINDTDRLRNEALIVFGLAFILILGALLAFVLMAVWQIFKGWNLFSTWKNSAKSKDELLSLAAHEMNSPLTAIKASLSIISQNYATVIPDEAASILSKTYNATQNLINLVEEVLTISRFERGKIEIYPRPVDLTEIAREVTMIFAEKAGAKGLSISMEGSTQEVPKVVADPDKIKEVISNFISNAIKYGGGGVIHILLRLTDNSVILSVSDNGNGIAAEDLNKLFHRFTRLKPTSQEGGTGLGLYISKLIIEAHKGRIWAESAVGKGSTFYFSLPLPKRLPS